MSTVHIYCFFFLVDGDCGAVVVFDGGDVCGDGAYLFLVGGWGLWCDGGGVVRCGGGV